MQGSGRAGGIDQLLSGYRGFLDRFRNSGPVTQYGSGFSASAAPPGAYRDAAVASPQPFVATPPERPVGALPPAPVDDGFTAGGGSSPWMKLIGAFLTGGAGGSFLGNVGKNITLEKLLRGAAAGYAAGSAPNTTKMQGLAKGFLAGNTARKSSEASQAAAQRQAMLDAWSRADRKFDERIEGRDLARKEAATQHMISGGGSVREAAEKAYRVTITATGDVEEAIKARDEVYRRYSSESAAPEMVQTDQGDAYRVETKEQYDALPEGALIQMPDGNVFRKPS